MTIQSLRKELKLTRYFLGGLFMIIVFLDQEIHYDYTRFLDTKEWMKTAEIEKIMDEAYENDLLISTVYIKTVGVIPPVKDLKNNTST